MSNWFPSLPKKSTPHKVIASLSTTAKESMLAAAKKHNFAKSTWNGCAFNAASQEDGQNIQGTKPTAEYFGMAPVEVSAFIGWWDSSPCTTKELVTAIETSLREDWSAKDDEVRRYEVLVHEHVPTEEEKFNSLVESLDLQCEDRDETQQEFAESVDLAGQLLFASA
jgi:hypothetical protein